MVINFLGEEHKTRKKNIKKKTFQSSKSTIGQRPPPSNDKESKPIACCLHKEIKMIEKREYKWPKDFNKDQKALRRDVVTMV